MQGERKISHTESGKIKAYEKFGLGVDAKFILYLLRMCGMDEYTCG
jgi:hypothetical protein